MSSRAMKDALVNQLVRPHVFEASRRVLAFRVLWRVHEDDLEAAWLDVVDSRRRSDEILRRRAQTAGDVSFFVSAVTGVFTKGRGSIKHGMPPGEIYPAISYWVVLGSESESDAVVTEQSLFRDIGEANPTASIKYIVTVRAAPLSLEAMAAPLFVTLKDHKDGFTQRKVQQSARHLGLSDTAIAKLVVGDIRCGLQLLNSHACLCERNLVLEFDMEPPDGSTNVPGVPPLALQFVPPAATLISPESADPRSSPPHPAYSY